MLFDLSLERPSLELPKWSYSLLYLYGMGKCRRPVVSVLFTTGRRVKPDHGLLGRGK